MRRKSIDRAQDHYRNVDSTRDHDLEPGFYTGYISHRAVNPTSSSTHDTSSDTLPSSVYGGSLYSRDGGYGRGSEFCTTPDSFFTLGSSHFLDTGSLSPGTQSMDFSSATFYSPEYFPGSSLDANTMDLDPTGSFYRSYPLVKSELHEYGVPDLSGNYARIGSFKEDGLSLAGPDLPQRNGIPDVKAKVEDIEVCRTCGIKFQRPYDLRRHERLHEDPNHPCRMPSCGRAFTRTDKLRDHLRSAHGVEENTSPNVKPALHCSVCRLTFDRPVELNRHNNRKHNLRFKCDICTRAFGLQTDLQRHQVAIHEMRTSQFSCSVGSCNFETRRKDNLLRHVKSKHGLQAVETAKGRSETIQYT